MREGGREREIGTASKGGGALERPLMHSRRGIRDEASAAAGFPRGFNISPR